jgi:hypothetical protein
MGPINLLKLSGPLFIFYVWKNRSRLEPSFLRFAAMMIAVGSLSALYAGIRCGSPTFDLREWGAMLLGCFAGACVAILPKRKALTICSSWIGIVLLSVGLELIAKNALKWIIVHFFDPTRGDLDPHGLMGFWDIASLGKLGLLAAWTFGYALFRSPALQSRLKWPLFAATTVIMFLVVVGSTQRGPMVGFAAGVFAFMFQEFRRTRNWKIIGTVSGLAVAAAAAAFLVIPSEHLMPRLRSMFFLQDNSYYGQESAKSRDQRIRISKLTFATIAQYPMGNACIPSETYLKYDLDPTHHGHAHSLILQQYRARGLVWGTLHLIFWIWALLAAFKRKSIEGSVLFAGLCAVFVLGLVDHPWFVVNQATMIGTLLLSAFAKQNDTESL